MLAAGKGRVLPVLAMLAAKRRLRVAARGSGPGAKRRRPCPPLRAAAAERRRDEERPAPSTPPPAGRTRNWTRCSAPRLPRRSQRCPLMRLGQHGPWQGFGSRVHTGAPGEDRRGPSPCHGPICCGSRLFQASSAIRAFSVAVSESNGGNGGRAVMRAFWRASRTPQELRRHGSEGPSLRKRTVKNENTGEILPVSGEKGRCHSDDGLNCLFAACNHGVQSVLHSIPRFDVAYCTQQTGGLTQGVTLREIHTTPANASGRLCWMPQFLASLVSGLLTRPIILRAIR